MRDFETVYVCNRCGETFTLEEGRTKKFDDEKEPCNSVKISYEVD